VSRSIVTARGQRRRRGRHRSAKGLRDGAQRTSQEDQARPPVPADALVRTAAAVFDEGFHVQNRVLGMDVLKEAIDEAGYVLVLERREAGSVDDEVRRGRVRAAGLGLVGGEQAADEGVGRILVLEDFPAQDGVGAGAVRRDLQEVARGLDG